MVAGEDVGAAVWLSAGREDVSGAPTEQPDTTKAIITTPITAGTRCIRRLSIPSFLVTGGG